MSRPIISPLLDRRTFIASAIAALASTTCASSDMRTSPPALRFGRPLPFSFEALVARARALSESPYQSPRTEELAQNIDYEQHGRIKFNPDCALHSGVPGSFPATFFHLGRFFKQPIRVYAIDGSTAVEIEYSPDYFEIPADSPARAPGFIGGFAGFRLQESSGTANWPTQDWLAFLGASYFRAIGASGQYGMSARGIAVNTTAGGVEEFPRFAEFYIDLTTRDESRVTIYALLDGPSVCGAYAFACHRGRGVDMDIDARIFVRNDVEQLGVAPLTSMFWYSEYRKNADRDWRPEVHDSDGLALWTGTGERIWRPLNNPDVTKTSSFMDRNPRGFGLLQRDRDHENYLDGVNYESRPSVWVEPRGDWGSGAVTLIEIPTDDEIHDNIVAFWKPAEPVRAGQSLQFRYRLYWQDAPPHGFEPNATVSATRLGRGGENGKPRPEGVTKFVVEFTNTELMALAKNTVPIADVTASRGAISNIQVERVPLTPRWRALFDLTPADLEPAELRLFLRSDDRALSETWLYQFNPAKVHS